MAVCIDRNGKRRDHAVNGSRYMCSNLSGIIESARWYYHCDRLGMIVCQDMVNGGSQYHMPVISYLPTLSPSLASHLKDAGSVELSPSFVKRNPDGNGREKFQVWLLAGWALHRSFR